MEAGSSGMTGLMDFGESSAGLRSVMTMMHGMGSNHPHANSDADNSASFLSLPSSTTNTADPNRNSSSGCSLMVDDRHNNSAWCYFMDHNNNGENNSSSALKAKIMAHPHYHRLLAAYLNCQKVGAPPEVILKVEEACASAASVAPPGAGCLGEDPALDQFMEAYCEMLIKYEQELVKPYKEAMLFLQKIECQFKDLIVSSDAGCEEGERHGSSSGEADIRNQSIDPHAEDRELKGQLLRRYSGYLGSLKQEFMKKRKKGKLPKEARQELLEWWTRHYKWPYPSEAQKVALAESTGLDQKQINNWFINQRKRHWKPSEDMQQFVVMDASSHSHPQYFMDGVLASPLTFGVAPTTLL